ncbi:uncharacterized protein B0H64DRAFT_102843 [Chaetomium fimeti]|uniref:N-acetylgalactosaminide beta-1,3-galactosyltransferase n=1 Tax=Chaetomium fimeti TaxID=1854472 RepID=A0AAE0LW02_9PEZI|nr:hypothetical protein B0H64DRAFT_102843 [Chaetomium fimeti]
MISPKSLYGPDRVWTPFNKMITRKSSLLLAIATISLLILLYTSRIGGWSGLDDPYYRPDHHHDPHKSQHAPQGSPQDAPHPPPSSPQPPPPPSDPGCEGFPDTSKVLLVMKTGASEAYARIPTQLMTMLRCLPDFLIFGDMDQNIGGQKIYDSLSTVLPEAQKGNSDFDLYRRQKWCLVDQEVCNKLGDPAREGWNLDKYKNVHIAEKAYKMRPDYDWYIFVDADTYVLWPNLMQWIKKLDAKKKLYLGSVTLIHNFSFGHGGSGYLVSQAAMNDFVGNNPGVANEYDVQAKKECCGDYMFARALKDKTDVGVQQMHPDSAPNPIISEEHMLTNPPSQWPTINGEKPATLPFGPSHWCHPVVTMHHMNAEEINAFWHFERRHMRKSSQPLFLRDIYDEFLAPHLNETREDWDNMADNRFYVDTESGREWSEWQLKRMKKAEEYNEEEKSAHKSFADCAAACKSLGPDECFRYKYTDGVCSISNAFIMGKPVKPADDEKDRVMSGWDIEKINTWVSEQAACSDVKWPNVKVD